MFKGNLGQIGLDVSDGSLEAVQLRSSRKSTSFQMVGWSRIVLPPGAVTAGIVMKEPDVVESLRQLFSKPTFGSLDGRQVVLSIRDLSLCGRFLVGKQWRALARCNLFSRQAAFTH